MTNIEHIKKPPENRPDPEKEKAEKRLDAFLQFLDASQFAKELNPHLKTYLKQKGGTVAEKASNGSLVLDIAGRFEATDKRFDEMKKTMGVEKARLAATEGTFEEFLLWLNTQDGALCASFLKDMRKFLNPSAD